MAAPLATLTGIHAFGLDSTRNRESTHLACTLYFIYLAGLIKGSVCSINDLYK